MEREDAGGMYHIISKVKGLTSSCVKVGTVGTGSQCVHYSLLNSSGVFPCQQACSTTQSNSYPVGNFHKRSPEISHPKP